MSQSVPGEDEGNGNGAGYEERIRGALEELHASGVRDNGLPKKSIRSVATHFNVSHSTLTNRWKGMKTRVESHADQQILTPAQEQILADWVKEQGRRGIPDTVSTLIEKASSICGHAVGHGWAYRFKQRHPDISSRWTQQLSTSRAGALHRTSVDSMYDLIEETRSKYNIKPQHEWNADEKGILDGVGERVRGLVDRTQRNVYQVENGERNLTTIIECVSATGRALRPCIIFKGQRLQKAWFTNNPENASISVSPNGWTDHELGSTWVEKDFDPETSKDLPDGEWRLLILDGHTSHCTLKFLSFCERRKIIVICLPPHTTHALQPCDVGVFGPLAHAWKKVVNTATRNGKQITKEDIPGLYAEARKVALKESTIVSAWRKCGLYPLDRSTIPETMFAPALNTTTKAAQPVPAALPPFLIGLAIPTPCSADTGGSLSRTASPSPPSDNSSSSEDDSSSSDGRDSDSDDSSDSSADDMATSQPTVPASTTPAAPSMASTVASYELIRLCYKELPPPLAANATRVQLLEENSRLRSMLATSLAQHEADHAQKLLMDAENETYRNKLLHRSSKSKRTNLNTKARHMTAAEALDSIALTEFTYKLQLLFKELRKHPRYKLAKKAQRDREKAAKKAVTDAAAAAARAQKQAERSAEAERKRQEKAAETERKQREKAAEAERKRQEKAAEAERTRAAKEAEKVRKQNEKAEKTAEAARKRNEKAVERRQKQQQKRGEPQPEREHDASSHAASSSRLHPMHNQGEGISFDDIPHSMLAPADYFFGQPRQWDVAQHIATSPPHPASVKRPRSPRSIEADHLGRKVARFDDAETQGIGHHQAPFQREVLGDIVNAPSMHSEQRPDWLNFSFPTLTSDPTFYSTNVSYSAP